MSAQLCSRFYAAYNWALHGRSVQGITRWFRNKTLESSSQTHPTDKLSQAKANQPKVEKQDYLKRKINLNMCGEDNSQGHKDTSMFTGQDRGP